MGGGSNGTGKTMEAGGAETQYIESKTSIWWDIENCQVPKGCDPHAIAQNISSALINMNYCGRISISAYGDTNRIPMTVQHALSSTGITLNHVPAGVKDASDKKILVDMLFWAVDNPAPANYLLISGDRDFSNALHQLRMRRYNILLAQPQNASAPLLAAAKSVWLWTSLLVGGPPLESGDTPQFGSNNNMSNSDMLKSSSSETMHIDSASDSYFHGNQKFANNGRGGDNKYKGKQTRKIPTQPNMSRTVSAPAGIQEPQTSDGGVNQQGYAQGKPFKEAPHEFFRANSPRPSSNGPLSNFFPPNPDPSWNNGNYQPQYPQAPPQNNIPPQPDFSQGRQFPQNSNSQGYRPLLPRPDVLPFTTAPPANNKQSISDYPNGIHYPPIFQQRNGGEVRPSSFTTPPSPANMNAPQYLHMSQSGPPYFHDAQNVRYAPRGPEFPTVYHDSRNTRYGHMSGPEHLPSSSPVGINSVPVWGTPGCPKPPEYTQGLIGVILLALDTLKNEKIIPTEANITDCIRYGDPKQRNTDVRTALESAIEHQMVVKHNVGTLIVYLRKNGALWKCVNFLERKNYPKPVWDGIQNFLSTPGGRSSITACQCRYEAAIALRNSCLKDYTLGDILQIVNMIITTKRWINVHPSGWKPIAIVLPIVKAEVPIVVKAEVDTITSA